MGELDQAKQVGGGGVTNAGPQTQPQIGKATLVDTTGSTGAVPTGTAPDTTDDPTVVPPEFKALDPDVISLLARSRATFHIFDGKKFWDALRAVPIADLHTLVDVSRGAKSTGVWPLIAQLTGFYTNATSWGLKFLAGGSLRSLAGGGSWGHDNPQFAVQREHEHTKHEWYRYASGSGNKGVHLGIDIGEGHNNVHWDPTNPMDHVSKGEMKLVPNPVAGGFPVPVYIPKGDAVYDPKALAEHALEIWGVTAPSGRANANKAFLRVTQAKKAADKAKFTDAEDGAPGVKDRARAKSVCSGVRMAIADIARIEQASRELAMGDDAENTIAAIDTRIAEAEGQLWRALAAFYQHLHAEAPGYPPDLGGYDRESDFTVDGFLGGRAYDIMVGLQKRRAAP